MAPENLTPYLSGKRVPGNKLQAKLRELECDLHWLMFGETREEVDLKFNRMMERKAREMMPEEFAMIDFLRHIGITKKEQLEEFLNPAGIAEDVAMVLREKLTKYRTKKRR